MSLLVSLWLEWLNGSKSLGSTSVLHALMQRGSVYCRLISPRDVTEKEEEEGGGEGEERREESL